MFSKLKTFYFHHKTDINWLIIAALLSSAAFALGYLSGQTENRTPIIIQKSGY